MNYTNFYKILLLFLVSSTSFSQIDTQLAPGFDLHNKEFMEVFNVWKAYLLSNPNQASDSPYWNPKDKENYKSYDLLKSHGFLNPGLYAFQTDNVVLYIKRIEDNYIIFSQFYWLDEGKMNPLAVTKVVAKKDKTGEYKLHNWLSTQTKNWKTKKYSAIKYIYPENYEFDLIKAEKANKFVEKLYRQFDIPSKTVEYYIFEDCDNLFQSTGFEYVISMGSIPNKCAFFDDENRIVYTIQESGVFHKHELIHLINIKYPNAHPLLLSGISVYNNSENSHLGESFLFHIVELNKTFNANPSIDLTDWDNIKRSNSTTEPFYFLGAVLCDLILTEGGIELFKSALNSISSNTDLFDFFEEELGLKRTELNDKMKHRFQEMAESEEVNFLIDF